ncbi:hypothetical protein M9H77_09487 [Catharanthus roseus]|uniref:Uncharacterized protein n=1 Tax=Catharanthus roseus TaxID=4058 RepID=A0ACC0C130_CATRO|nr:hypothetical protein M9H77_09487 [Catharanthus roseus]
MFKFGRGKRSECSKGISSPALNVHLQIYQATEEPAQALAHQHSTTRGKHSSKTEVTWHRPKSTPSPYIEAAFNCYRLFFTSQFSLKRLKKTILRSYQRDEVLQ